MFTPSNIKKLVNMTVITLKYKNTFFQVPIYPNTLQSFLKGLIPIDSITLSTRIYKNVSKGELQTDANINMIPGNTIEDRIEYILRNGTDKEDDLTRKLQAEKKIKTCGLFLTNKLRYKKRRITYQKAQEVCKTYSLIGDEKTIATAIARDIVKTDPNFEIIKYRIKTDQSIIDQFKLTDRKDDFYRIDGETLFEIKKICTEKKIIYELEYESDEEDEIIC